MSYTKIFDNITFGNKICLRGHDILVQSKCPGYEIQLHEDSAINGTHYQLEVLSNGVEFCYGIFDGLLKVISGPELTHKQVVELRMRKNERQKRVEKRRERLRKEMQKRRQERAQEIEQERILRLKEKKRLKKLKKEQLEQANLSSTNQKPSKLYSNKEPSHNHLSSISNQVSKQDLHLNNNGKINFLKKSQSDKVLSQNSSGASNELQQALAKRRAKNDEK